MRKILCLTVALMLPGACADYQFTINERVVYTPAPPFADYTIDDGALNECVKQTVLDGSITAAAQLTELNCSHAGVSTLLGIEVFSHIERLKLSNNSITDLAPLATLARLQVLHVEENQIRSLMPLRGLADLSQLNVRGNPTLICAQLDHFAGLPGLTLERPKHCSG
jgi:Leucine-rich repeat (LRR) protein